MVFIVPVNTTVKVLGRNANRTFVKIDFNGQIGWASSGFISLNNRVRLASLALCLLAAAMCGCRNPDPPAVAGTAAPATRGIGRASIDTSVAPGDDFYKYANGAWLKETEIPEDLASFGITDVLDDQAQQRTKALLEDAGAGKAAPGSDERKAGDYYASYMDDPTIEKRGLSPLIPALDAIKTINDRPALARWIGQSLRADVDSARRLVEDQHLRLRLQPLADHDLLLVAPGQRRRRRLDRGRADAELPGGEGDGLTVIASRGGNDAGAVGMFLPKVV